MAVPNFKSSTSSLLLMVATTMVGHISANISTGVFSSCVTEQTLALTYDDGPSEFTDELLDVLKTHGVKATFFVNGIKLEAPEMATILKRAYDEGHLIASHTYSHTDLTMLSREEVLEETQKNEDIIFKAIGERVRYVRPPYGSYNDVTNDAFFELGYKNILWNLDTNDWKHKDNPDQIVSISLNALSTGNPAFPSLHAEANPGPLAAFISLQHDTFQTTLEVQDELITKIKLDHPGITFLTVDECLGFERGDGYRVAVETQEPETQDPEITVAPPITTPTSETDDATSFGFVNPVVSMTSLLISLTITMW